MKGHAEDGDTLSGLGCLKPALQYGDGDVCVCVPLAHIRGQTLNWTGLTVCEHEGFWGIRILLQATLDSFH